MVLDNGDFWVPEDFQLEVAADIFAGTPEVWMIVPEGNGKTTLMSSMGLYHGDYTQTAMVLMAAASRDQAGLLFSQAAGFVERSPGFTKRFRVFEGYRKIKCIGTSGVIQVFAADDRTGDGVIPTMAFLDELHRHRDMKLYRTWRGKLPKRDGQLITISTAGEPGTEFEDARAKALGDASSIVFNGSHTRAASEDMVIHDFSVPKDGDVEDMEVVKAANPLQSITVEDLAKKRRSPAMTLTHWQRFVCNQAVRSEETAIDPMIWADLGTDEEIPAGESVWLGVDFGWKHDTTAIVPLWVRDDEYRLFGTPIILTPPRDGSFLDPGVIKQAFRDLTERYAVVEVVMDPDRAAEIAAWLQDDLGIEPTVHGQGVEMYEAYEKLTEAVRNRWIRHPRDPEFTEHVLNAVAKTFPDGRARFDRPSSSRAQAGQRRRVIDALIAAAMVHHSAIDGPDDVPFVFEVLS